MNKIKKKRINIALAAYGLVVGFLLFTNPDSLPLPLLIAPFILMFVAVYQSIQLLLGKYFANLGARARLGLSIGLTGLPILLMLLQSIGQLSLRDVLITLGLAGGLVLYFRKTDFLK